jgi:hypothetical protein
MSEHDSPAMAIARVEVKANEYLSAVEREQLRALRVPANVTREYWRFVDGQPGNPRIEIR